MNAPDFAAGELATAARRRLAEALRGAEIEAAETDARLLVQHALGLDRGALVRDPARTLGGRDVERLRELALRRLRREPVAQILGRKEFWGLDFVVTPATLIPRPETETLVETALSRLAESGPRSRPLRIADAGTGSGAILVAMLSEYTNAFGVGTDRSAEALRVAGENARACGLADRSAFVRCDFTRALAGGFDLLLSNPPYIRSLDIASLAPEIRDYEPHAALDGGADGLDAYRALALDADRVLAPGGLAILEIGAGQHEEIVEVFARRNLEQSGAPVADLAGIRRVLVFGRR